jgi:hypothetical protein
MLATLAVLWTSATWAAVLTAGSLPDLYSGAAARRALVTTLIAAPDACTRYCRFEATGGLLLIVETAGPLHGPDRPVDAFSLTYPGDGEIDDFGAALTVLLALLDPTLSDAVLSDHVDAMIRAQDSEDSADVVVGDWGISGNAAAGGTFVVFGQRAGARR